MAQKEIANFITLETADGNDLAKAKSALQAVLKEQAEDTRELGVGYWLSTDWEPPFSALKTFSKEFPDVTLRLWADAFAKNHWLCKSEIKAGKCTDSVVSRVDDAFDSIFQEVFGVSNETWEQAPVDAFGEHSVAQLVSAS